MRDVDAAERAVELYADMVRRICLIHLKNREDTEDIFQEVFLKYFQSDAVFFSQDHEKAWLIRVALNACKDLSKSFARVKVRSFDELGYEPACFDEADRCLIDALTRLPAKYRCVIYLHYYEGYSVPELSGILKRNENTLYTWLSRGKAEMRRILGGEKFEV